jgi:hypothetical protein
VVTDRAVPGVAYRLPAVLLVVAHRMLKSLAGNQELAPVHQD